MGKRKALDVKSGETVLRRSARLNKAYKSPQEDADPGADPDTSSNNQTGQHADPKYEGCIMYNGTLYPPCCGWRSWPCFAENAMKAECEFLSYEILEWIQKYGGENMEVVDKRLSARKKQAVIDALGDYCLPNDWSSLVDLLPSKTLQKLPTILVECMIGRDIYKNIIQNPFFYVSAESSTRQLDRVPTALGMELYTLSQRLVNVNKVKAHRIREEMVQLLNGFGTWEQCQERSVGIQSRKLRKSAAEVLVSRILDAKSSPLKLILRKLSRAEAKECFESLVMIYRKAGELSVWFFTQPHIFEYEDNIHHMNPYDGPARIHAEETPIDFQVPAKMVPHSWSEYDFHDGILNGRHALLMVRPLIKMLLVKSFWWEHPPQIEQVKHVSRAKVVLSKVEPLEKDMTRW